MRILKCGNIDWESLVEESDWFGAVLDSRNGAADDDFLVWLRNASASIAREEVLAGSNEAAVGRPNIINDRWDYATVHMAWDEEVKFVKVTGDFGIEQIDWRMDECDFGFVLWQVVNKFMVELM